MIRLQEFIPCSFLDKLKKLFQPIRLIDGADKRGVGAVSDNIFIEADCGYEVFRIFGNEDAGFAIQEFGLAGDDDIVIFVGFDDVCQGRK